VKFDIIGAYGTINNRDTFLSSVHKLAKRHEILIQVFDASKIFGRDHLHSAILHALRAKTLKTMSTKSLKMEVLLYASGERQIQKAIDKMGIKKQNTTVAIILFYHKRKPYSQMFKKKVLNEVLKISHLKRNDKVLEGDVNTLKEFGFTDQEIQAVPKSKYKYLILEKVALVDIIK
jgi:KEOPS complex subunit Cgi121